MLRLLAFILLALTALVVAPPPEANRPSLQPRQNQPTCSAEIRKNKLPIGARALKLKEDAGEELDLEKRTFWKHAQCHVTGSFPKTENPSQTKGMISVQSCADWCKCELDRINCKTFSWTEDASMSGLGTCNLYTRGLNHMKFVPGTGSGGMYYERGCFKKGTPTGPPVTMTSPTGPPSYRTPAPAPAPVEKRDDASERFWALVLAET